MDLKITAKNVNISEETKTRIYVDIQEVFIDELIEVITIEEFLNNVDVSVVLDVIGEKICKDHFS
jgi:uncharacterized protein (UPF0276 family)